jgi:hypothetical protein
MKYIIIKYKPNDPHSHSSVWHGYAEDIEAAKAQLLADPLNGGGVKVILETTVLGFDIGDRVRVTNAFKKLSTHDEWLDLPGVVIAYAFDGYVIVEWADFDVAEEFHWTELEPWLDEEFPDCGCGSASDLLPTDEDDRIAD